MDGFHGRERRLFTTFPKDNERFWCYIGRNSILWRARFAMIKQILEYEKKNDY